MSFSTPAGVIQTISANGTMNVTVVYTAQAQLVFDEEGLSDNDYVWFKLDLDPSPLPYQFRVYADWYRVPAPFDLLYDVLPETYISPDLLKKVDLGEFGIDYREVGSGFTSVRDPIESQFKVADGFDNFGEFGTLTITASDTSEYWLRVAAAPLGTGIYTDPVQPGGAMYARFVVLVGVNLDPTYDPRNGSFEPGWVQTVTLGNLPGGDPGTPPVTPPVTPPAADPFGQLPATPGTPDLAAASRPKQKVVEASHVVYGTDPMAYDATTNQITLAPGQKVSMSTGFKALGKAVVGTVGTIVDKIGSGVNELKTMYTSATTQAQTFFSNLTSFGLNQLDTVSTVATDLQQDDATRHAEAQTALLEQQIVRDFPNIDPSRVEGLAALQYKAGVRVHVQESDISVEVDFDARDTKAELTFAAGHHDLFLGSSGKDVVRGGDLADYLWGADGADRLFGDAGADALAGGTGDDELTGGAGNDLILGGAGAADVAIYSGARSSYLVAQTSGGWTVVDRRGGSPDGTDTVKEVERIRFSDGELAIGAAASVDAAVGTGVGNILRGATSGASASAVLAGDLSVKVATGQLSPFAAIGEIVRAAATTTSVATLSYQFFTGKIPSAGGLDYLVSATGPNPNNLNSAYYQSFNLENRYINFAVNLGRDGDGKAAFLAAYGGLSLFEATRTAYTTIFGGTPSDAKLHALLDPVISLGGQTFTRGQYFAIYGGDGANGIGTKAAMVGFLLAEAVKADIGVYAKVNDAYLMDLADGAAFLVNIVGAYNRPEYVFNPG